MKKFLSLVLSLVMTMSLVTIGAGATEYKDLTDNGDIQYEEAVAVLNKIGIITGYEDGSFKPTSNLSRGAAAKIIVSLMIGPEAAAALSVTAAPYKDVPVTNTFAAVISYCKTAGYISGYGDNTFRPADPLTGYAFAKMLLGALGFDSKAAGFTGAGWTMNVASIGNAAGLYNDFKTTFQGNKGVTREEACQLGLNTLKATMVEYVGGTSVTTGDASVVINGTLQYKTSNDAKINRNISDKKSTAGSDLPTLEFGEEHFRDLKLLGNATTDFNRPAVQWSFKNVTIGKFANTPDFTFSAAPAGDTAKDKVKSMNLNNYAVYDGTNVIINEQYISNALTNAPLANAVDVTNTSDTTGTLKGANIAEKLVNLFGNGILVEVYLDDDVPDVISDIVVIRSQMMEVNTVSAKTITLKQADEVGNDDDATTVAVDKYFKPVATVKDADNAFAGLKDTKVGDYMMVTYVGSTATSKEVYSSVAPTTVTGALSGITRTNNNVVNSVTVGGTVYKLAAICDDDFAQLDASKISATRKDVTLYLDAYGYATYIKDAGIANDFMIYGNSYQTLVNGKLVTTLEGWDMKGNAISINVGTTGTSNSYYGDLVKYTSDGVSGGADYMVKSKVAAAPALNTPGHVESNGAAITAGQSTLTSAGGTTYKIASGIKTFFVTYDTDNTVKSVYMKDGVAAVTALEAGAYYDQDGNGSKSGNEVATQYMINKSGAVEAIVVKTDSSDAISDKVLFVEAKTSDNLVDGVRTYTYNVWVNGGEDSYTSTDSINAGSFATYAEQADGTYRLGQVTRTDGATSAFKMTVKLENIDTANKSLIYGVNGVSSAPYENTKTIAVTDMAGAVGAPLFVAAGSVLNTSSATFSDLTENGLSSMKAIYEYLSSPTVTAANDEITLTFVMNNKIGANDYLKVSAVSVTGIK